LSHCEGNTPPIKDRENLRKVLLMGNPNVGKSVIFSRLTGFDVVASNYTGTTVSFNKGLIRYKGEKAILTDVPGIYGLDATSKAEEVAIDMLNEGADLIVCVLDSTHLERNLNLALALRNYNIPTVYALNLSDVAFRRGIEIDIEALSERLKAPVIETVAVKKIGIDLLKDQIFMEQINEPLLIDAIDEEAKDIAESVTHYHEVKLSWLEKIGDWSIKPLTGIPIAILMLAATIGFVVGGGKALRALIFLPFVNNIYTPFITWLVGFLLEEGSLLYGIFVGEYGFLIKMIEWPIALILPYVFLFYVAFSFLEDSGYLPRLGVLLDGAFRKLGLPGSNIIPFLMGYGCAIPAVLGTRAAGSQKERIITVSMIAIAVPCTAQTGAFIALLGDQSIVALVSVYLISILAIILTGVILNKTLKGYSRPLILEIPNLLLPDFKSLSKKIWIKIKHFLKDAQGPMLIGIILASLLVETGALEQVGIWLEPLVTGWLGLPKEASLSLILGIIRRELAVMPLIEMNLTTTQLITGSVVALFYLPCISTLFVLVKEFKLKVALMITAATFFFAFFFGGVVNHFLGLFF